jgi:hypothetical protein
VPNVPTVSVASATAAMPTPALVASPAIWKELIEKPQAEATGLEEVASAQTLTITCRPAPPPQPPPQQQSLSKPLPVTHPCPQLQLRSCHNHQSRLSHNEPETTSCATRPLQQALAVAVVRPPVLKDPDKPPRQKTPLPKVFGVCSRPSAASNLKLLLPVRERSHYAKQWSHAMKSRSSPVHGVVLLGLTLFDPSLVVCDQRAHHSRVANSPSAPVVAAARSFPITPYSASRRHLISRPLSTCIHHLSPPHRLPPLLHHSLLPPRRPLPLPLVWPPTRTLPTPALPRHLTRP